MPQYFRGQVTVLDQEDLRDIAFFEEEVVGFTDFEGERERTAQKFLVARTDRRHALGR